MLPIKDFSLGVKREAEDTVLCICVVQHHSSQQCDYTKVIELDIFLGAHVSSTGS